MANYCCTTRTNYFRVTDEKKYRELFGRLVSEDRIKDFTETDENGVTWHGFGSYGSVDYPVPGTDGEDGEYDFGRFAEELRRLAVEEAARMLGKKDFETRCEY